MRVAAASVLASAAALLLAGPASAHTQTYTTTLDPSSSEVELDASGGPGMPWTLRGHGRVESDGGPRCVRYRDWTLRARINGVTRTIDLGSTSRLGWWALGTDGDNISEVQFLKITFLKRVIRTDGHRHICSEYYVQFLT